MFARSISSLPCVLYAVGEEDVCLSVCLFATARSAGATLGETHCCSGFGQFIRMFIEGVSAVCSDFDGKCRACSDVVQV